MSILRQKKKKKKSGSVHFSPLTDWFVEENMTDDSAEILFKSFMQEAVMSSSSMSIDAHSLMLSIQHFFCLLQHCPPSTESRGIVSGRLSWHVTSPNHASFCLLTVARRGSCGSTRKLILLCTKLLVLSSKLEMPRSFLRHLVSKA